MVVGTLQLELKLGSPQSLKEKRMILKSLTARIRRQFNVSVAEVSGMDLWQRSGLVLSAVGRERSHVNQTLDHILI